MSRKTDKEESVNKHFFEETGRKTCRFLSDLQNHDPHKEMAHAENKIFESAFLKIR